MAVKNASDRVGSGSSYNLNSERGITNIGSHPDNDIVLEGPGIALFHLMIDHRKRPYRVVILSQNADVRVNGYLLNIGDPFEVMDLNQVEVGPYRLNIQDSGSSSPLDRISFLPSRPTGPSSDYASAAGQPSLRGTGFQPAVPVRVPAADDAIKLKLKETHQVVDVERTATFHLTVTNNGPLVASFNIQVNDTPFGDVKIEPALIKLHESESGTVEIRITPEKSSRCTAQEYPLTFVVTSTTYQGAVAEAGAILEVKPFYNYRAEGPSPQILNIAYSKKAGPVGLAITNYGNSPVNYAISAADSENECRFQFPTDTGEGTLHQSNVLVAPGEKLDILMLVAPAKRRFFGVRGQRYSYNVKIKPEYAADEWLAHGDINSRPRFGLLHLILTLLTLAIFIYLLFLPRIYEFDAPKKIVRLGEPVTLRWSVWPLVTSLKIPGITDPIRASQNEIAVVPSSTVTSYNLIAGTWLSSMIPRGDAQWPQPVTVLALPESPIIDTFKVDKNEILTGDQVNVKWSTRNADEVRLTVEGVTSVLKPEEFNGERDLVIRSNTLVVLEARNTSGVAKSSAYVSAVQAEHTGWIKVTPSEIVQGEKVTIEWNATGYGIKSVNISAFKDPLSLSGKEDFYPEASSTFVMTINTVGENKFEPQLASVKVLPAKEAPVINFFKVVPDTLNAPGKVQLSWSITGNTDRVEITSSNNQVAKKEGLPQEGFLEVNIGATTSLMIVAYNGPLSAAASVEVQVTSLRATKTSITSVQPTTSLRVGDTVFVQAEVLPVDDKGNTTDPKNLGLEPVSGVVQVTNGFDNCKFELPLTGCALTLTKMTGVNITATYLGDGKIYARSTSAPYTGLQLIGNPADMTITYTFASTNGPVIGESVRVNFKVTPRDSRSKIPVTGKVDVIVEGKVACTGVDLQPDKDNDLAGVGFCPNLVFDTASQKSFRFKFYNSDTYAPFDNVYDSTLVVKPADTVTRILTDLSAPRLVGEPITISVSVQAAAPGSGIPTGNVVIRDIENSTDSCTATLNQGIATCSLKLFNASVPGTDGALAPRRIEATYQGSNKYNFSVDSSGRQLVNPAATSVVFTNFAPASGVGEYWGIVNVTVDVQVTQPGAGEPAGAVAVRSFYTESGVNILAQYCEIRLPDVSSCALRLDHVGPLTFEAEYLGSTDYLRSNITSTTYSVVKAKTQTTITRIFPESTNKNTLLTVEYEVTMANPSNSFSPSGNIFLRSDTNESNLGNCVFDRTITPNQFSCTIMLTVEGQRSITAYFEGNSVLESSTSEPKIAYILKTSEVSITTFQSSAIVGQEVVFNYNVISTDNTGTPQGGSFVVSAVNQWSTSATCDPISGTNSCRITFPQAGAYTITVTYTGDQNYAADTSTLQGSLPDGKYEVSMATTTITDITVNKGPVELLTDPFVAAFQVLNQQTNFAPSGTAYLYVTEANNICRPDNTPYDPVLLPPFGPAAPAGHLTVPQILVLNQAGEGITAPLTLNNPAPAAVFLSVYYVGEPGAPVQNFQAFCFSKQVYP